MKSIEVHVKRFISDVVLLLYIKTAEIPKNTEGAILCKYLSLSIQS